MLREVFRERAQAFLGVTRGIDGLLEFWRQRSIGIRMADGGVSQRWVALRIVCPLWGGVLPGRLAEDAL